MVNIKGRKKLSQFIKWCSIPSSKVVVTSDRIYFCRTAAIGKMIGDVILTENKMLYTKISVRCNDEKCISSEHLQLNTTSS
jgi:hypothetical protein